MEYIMSMVHHNPGEAPFITSFNNPAKLKEYGYNTQVFKHLNAALSFEAFDERIFPSGSEERAWVESFCAERKKEIALAKQSGLSVMYHLDLFVLPKKIVELYGKELCDEDGKISVHKDMTLQIHRYMLEEMFQTFPEVDGLIIRVGETYLHDTPYHTGNGAVRYGDKEAEKESFVRLLQFLREEVCVLHNRKLIFRTWDCFPDRFHADVDYYLSVTDRIEPHGNLLFSIKHTALDFWRRVKFNDCLAKGKHRQVVEVQCQREYEGKGAYPSYVMEGIIASFEEYEPPVSLRDIATDDRISGIFAWPRGGGWFGPYPRDEFWSDLNAYVIGKYAENPTRTEEDIFFEYTRKYMKLSAPDSKIFRTICRLSQTAILKGRYIEAYDSRFHGRIMPCANWMRDDRLGGFGQLSEVLETLKIEGTLHCALKEKRQAVELWEEIVLLCKSIHWGNPAQGAFICTSAEYGKWLFTLVYAAWVVMVKWTQGDTDCLDEDIQAYYDSLATYQKLAERPECSSLYKTEYWHAPGIGETIKTIHQALCRKKEGK